MSDFVQIFFYEPKGIALSVLVVALLVANIILWKRVLK